MSRSSSPLDMTRITSTYEYCPKENHIHIVTLICMYLSCLFIFVNYSAIDADRQDHVHASLVFTSFITLYTLYLLYYYYIRNECFNVKTFNQCIRKNCSWATDTCVKVFKHRLLTYLMFFAGFTYLLIFGIHILDTQKNISRVSIISGVLGLLFCIVDFFFC